MCWLHLEEKQTSNLLILAAGQIGQHFLVLIIIFYVMLENRQVSRGHVSDTVFSLLLTTDFTQRFLVLIMTLIHYSILSASVL